MRSLFASANILKYWALFFLLMLVAESANKEVVAQQLEFALTIGGGGLDEGFGITTDEFGNVYVTGHFAGTVDFDPGPGVHNLTSTGQDDIFVARYNGTSGNLEWAHSAGHSNSNDQGRFIFSVAGGQIYATATFENTVDFDPGPGVFNLTSNGINDCSVSQYNAATGDLVWAFNIGSTSFDGCPSVIADASSIYVAGQFFGTVDFDPGPGVFNRSSNGDSDIFIASYDATTGAFQWAISAGSSLFDRANNIATDGTGVYLTGLFKGTTDFDPGPGVFNLTPTGANGIIVARYDALTGGFNWAIEVGGNDTGGEEGRVVATDGIGGVYVAGAFGGTADFDPGAGVFSLTSNGQEDFFLAKYDASTGDFGWATGWGSTSADRGNGIAVNGSGTVFVTGAFHDTIDLIPGPGIYNLTSNGDFDAFVAEYDAATGALDQAYNIGGTGSDRSFDLALGGSDRVHIIGRFEGTVDFDPGPGISERTSNGDFDAFIAKYGPDNVAPTADAGSDQSVIVGETVQLNGGDSSDPDEDPLTFDWSFLAKPPGSLATLSDPTAVNPTFTADVPGDYVLQLLVNDSTVDSSPDEVTITAQTVEEGINVLQMAIDDLLAAGLITEKGAKKLGKELDKALKELAKGKPEKSSKKLEKFIKEVGKLVDKGDLAEADGAALIASAEALIAVLEGGAGKGGPVEQPAGYTLSAAYPNPFNPQTMIRFSLPESAAVRLVVYDMLGRQVRLLVDGTRAAGTHEVVFEAAGLSSGMYLARLETPAGSFVQTMQLVK